MAKRGQPTKYREEYSTPEFLLKFLKHCKAKGLLVSLCSLAVYCDCCEDTIQEWKKVHQEFSVSLEKIKQIEKEMLVNKGLKGKYNSTIAKLLLSANHKVIETTAQKLSGEVVLKPPRVK